MLLDVLNLDVHSLFTNTNFDVSGSNVEIIPGGVRFCNPPILLPGSLFAMIFLSPGLVGLLITEIIVSLRTLCDRVTR